MNQRVHIICHMNAGSGRGARVLKEATRLLEQFKMTYIVHTTQADVPTELLTQQIIKRHAAKDLKSLLVIGGDGTLHEVVLGLYQMQAQTAITYLPAGTGNDFARTWYKGFTRREIIEHMIFGRKAVLVPIFTYSNLNYEDVGVIINSMGFGLDGEINYQALRLRKHAGFGNRFLGKFSYVAAIGQALKQIPHFQVKLLMDGKEYVLPDVTMLTVVNNPYGGGGLLLDNQTQATDEEFAVIAIHDIRPSTIWNVIYHVLLRKTHDKSPYVTRLTGMDLELSIEDRVRSQVDGEDLTQIQAQVTFGRAEVPFYIPSKDRLHS